MKIDFDKVLQDPLETGPLLTPEKKEPMSLRFACVFGLSFAAYPQEGFESHMKRSALVDKIKYGGEVDLSSEEVTLCKQALAKGWTISAVVGQGAKLLEGA